MSSMPHSDDSSSGASSSEDSDGDDAEKRGLKRENYDLREQVRRLKEEVRKKDFNIDMMGAVATPGAANPDSVLAMKDEEHLTRADRQIQIAVGVLRHWVKKRVWPNHKFLNDGWAEYSPHHQDVSGRAMKEIGTNLPPGLEPSCFWIAHCVPLVKKIYKENRANTTGRLKRIYHGELRCLLFVTKTLLTKNKCFPFVFEIGLVNNGWITWKTGMRDYLDDVAKIKTIDSRMILTLWKSPAFVKFVFFFCTRISNDMRSLVNDLLQENSNLFEHVTPSDIAWGGTVYVNNQEYWDMKVKGKDTGEDVGTTMTQGAAKSPEGQEEEEEEVTTPQQATPPRRNPSRAASPRKRKTDSAGREAQASRNRVDARSQGPKKKRRKRDRLKISLRVRMRRMVR